MQLIYELKLEKGIDEISLKVITEYWLIEDQKFVNKVRNIGLQYNLTLFEVQKLVAKKSSYKINLGKCNTCEKTESAVVYSRSAFLATNLIIDNCIACKRILIANEQEKERIESIERKEFNAMKWKTQQKNKQYKSYSSNDTEFDKEISNTLGFSLFKNKNKTTSRQPYFSTVFTLSHDVILKKGEKYIAGGWIQTDQSLNVKFTPLSDLENRTTHTDVENEPKSVKDILNDMYNDLDSENPLPNDN